MYVRKSRYSMTTVLITGPIGSGKSEVRRYLSRLGYSVYDCDSAVKGLYDTVPGLRERIEKALEISWSEIGVIFEDEGKRLKLEQIVYPILVADILRWKESNKEGGRPIFLESAIALQKPSLSGLWDKVLLVRSSESLRLSRNPKVAVRDSLQSFDETKADYLVDNEGTKTELYSKIDKILCKLI